MVSYIFKRLLLVVPTMFGAAVLIFLALRVFPGDIVEIKLRSDGGGATIEQIEQERKALGLDRPMPVQFVDWISGVARLDFGNSMWTGNPVSEEIGVRFQLTIQVAIMATIIGLIIALPLGILSGLKPNSWQDYAIRMITMAGLSVPAFWFGMIIILLLLHFFGWLPPLVYTPFWVDPIANLQQLIWPALSVGYRFSAIVARMIRSSIMEVMREDYIRTARAKGVSRTGVVILHALKNALLPAITVVGMEFTFMIGGLVVTEQVFNLNGIGKLLVDSIVNLDFVTVQAIVMILAFLFIVVNLLVDLLYVVLDPRTVKNR